MRTVITTQPSPIPYMRLREPSWAPAPTTAAEKAQEAGHLALEDSLEVAAHHEGSHPFAAGFSCVPGLCWGWPDALMASVAPRKKHGIKRDFERYPAIVDVPQRPQHLYALSDNHGDFDRTVKLLSACELVACDREGDVHWSGGTATLINCGDMIDKGPKNLELLELWQQLQREANKAGGRVIVVLGNHEVEFLADPYNDKAMGPGGIFYDLEEFGIDSKVFASDKHPTGYWLRRLPLGARVGEFFFAHGGQTSGRSLFGLNEMLVVALKDNGFHDDLVGGPDSISRARNWYGSDGKKGQEWTRLLVPFPTAEIPAVKINCHGHDPDSEGRGKVRVLPETGVEKIVCLDTGMSVGINYSHGELLHAFYTEKGMRMEACGPTGKTRQMGLF